MKFSKKSINEMLTEAILLKEKWARPGSGEDGDEDTPVIEFEGMDIGYCGINDAVPGCSC